MGSCVSLHKDPESAFKLRLDFGSKTDKLVNPSPDKLNNQMATDAAVFKSHWSPAPPFTAARDFGSKEETFFDSRPWLDSDCEDDFFSVKGDFTPSRGNTPVHERFSAKGPGNGVAEPSPTGTKKRLSELFKDNVGSEQEDAAALDSQKVSGNTTPYVSQSQVNSTSGDNQRSPNSEYSQREGLEKSGKPVQCCLPRLRSFRERKKM